MAARGSRPRRRHNEDIGIIAVSDHGAQREDGFGAFQAPPCPGDVEPVADQVAAGSFYYPGGDGPARGQGLVVAQVLVLAGQVADARVGTGPLGGGQASRVCLGGDLGGGAVAVPGQHRERFDRYPVLGCRITGGMQGPGGFPDVFEHVDEVDHDVDGDTAAGGLGADQAELMLGPGDEDHPGPPARRATSLGLAERGGNRIGRIVPY